MCRSFGLPSCLHAVCFLLPGFWYSGIRQKGGSIKQDCVRCYLHLQDCALFWPCSRLRQGSSTRAKLCMCSAAPRVAFWLRILWYRFGKQKYMFWPQAVSLREMEGAGTLTSLFLACLFLCFGSLRVSWGGGGAAKQHSFFCFHTKSMNYNDLTRPHPKWWFMWGIAPRPPYFRLV